MTDGSVLPAVSEVPSSSESKIRSTKVVILSIFLPGAHHTVAQTP